MKPSDFAIGSLESRALARMQAQHIRGSKRRIEIISNVPRPQHTLPPGTNHSVPYAEPWQETQGGVLLRHIYRPGEWKTLPTETVPVCPDCGTSFRQRKEQIGDLAWFEADCMDRHI
jgi:hypothetical protein